MQWRGRRQSDNVEDRRGQGSGGFGGLGGGFPGGGLGRGRIPIGMGGGGGLGRGGIIIILIVLAVLWFAGINPLQVIEGVDSGGGLDSGGSTISGSAPSGKLGVPSDDLGQFVSTVLADTEDFWGKTFKESGATYRNPKLVLFSGQTSSACGFASAASGPFYCPNDERLYLDLDFFDELQKRFGAPGDFAQAYVIAHEVGHHVQKLAGVLKPGQGNEQSVRTELQADCYAGVWAHGAQTEGVLDPGDIDEALNAAAQVGDDSIQKRSQGRVVPESFTHGTAEQRSRWFKRGFESGDPDQCDTVAASTL